MTWRLEDIERDWIGPEVSAVAVSPDSVIAAFDRTERTLGREWIEKSRISVGNIVRGMVNPHARLQLPGWIGNVLAEIGDEFKRITSA